MSTTDSTNNNEKDIEEVDNEISDFKLNVGHVIDSFLHRILDIEDCAREFVSLASTQYDEKEQRIMLEMESNVKKLEDENIDKENKLIATRDLWNDPTYIDRNLFS